MNSKKRIYISILLLILVFGFSIGVAVYNKNKVSVIETTNNKILAANPKDISKNTSSNDVTTNESESAEKLSRFDGQGNVQVNAILEKASEDNQQYIIVKVQFSTHSVNLDLYNFSKNVSFKTSEGINLLSP